MLNSCSMHEHTGRVCAVVQFAPLFRNSLHVEIEPVKESSGCLVMLSTVMSSCFRNEMKGAIGRG